MNPPEPQPRSPDSDTVRRVEQNAFDAWPPAEVQTLGSWRLRFNHGVTNRANSVWAFGPTGIPVDRAIEEAEAFYAARGQAPIFQLSPLSEPADLDARLAERGYVRHSPVTVRVASASHAASVPASHNIAVETAEHLDENWFEISGMRGRYHGDAIATYRRMMERVADRACFVVARRAGTVAGVGRGTSELYLQVEEDNAAAQTLYRRAGFETLYRYAYRQKREAG